MVCFHFSVVPSSEVLRVEEGPFNISANAHCWRNEKKTMQRLLLTKNKYFRYHDNISCLAGKNSSKVTSTSISDLQSTRPPRFYTDEKLDGVCEGEQIYLSKDESRHALRSLRLREGAVIELCDGFGITVIGNLISGNSREQAVVEVKELPIFHPPEGIAWTVAVASGSLKGGRADWLVEKITELNADTLQPLITERSPSIGGSNDQKNTKANENDMESSGRISRWHRVAAAAMKQSLRTKSLGISSPCTIEELCKLVSSADVAMVGVEGASPIYKEIKKIRVVWMTQDHENMAREESSPGSSRNRNVRHGNSLKRCRTGIIIIGPEGDFTSKEIEDICSVGAIPVGLGKNRLRTETAAIALLSYASLFFTGSD